MSEPLLDWFLEWGGIPLGIIIALLFRWRPDDEEQHYG